MVTTNETKIRKKLTRLAKRQQEVLEKLGSLFEDPATNSGQIQRAQREQQKLFAEQERLLTDLSLAQLQEKAGSRTPGEVAQEGRTGRRPMREQALDVLEEIGVPAAPRTVSEFARCFEISLPAARFSSLRRDEAEAYKKNPLSRPSWVVPAISVVGLTAIPRLVCSSSWEDERRVIASRTLHVNHLKILLALLEAQERTPHLAEVSAERVRELVTRYAASVPGALEFGEEPDYERVRAVAGSELKRVEKMDHEERQAAAEKMAKMADLHRLWGRPAAIAGSAEGKAR